MNRPLRVAFFGDMNNNFFSFMRHLRDLGVDAHLFLYKNQDKVQPRWAPQSDTYEWDKWKDYVHQTNCRAQWQELLWGDMKALRRDFEGFDITFISGFAAALFARAGILPDYYMPYAIGFEIINRGPRKGLRGFVDRLQIYWQTRGVHSARKTILTSGDKQTEKKAIALDLNYQFFTSVPMVYVESDVCIIDPDVSEIIKIMQASDFVVSSHVRHDWVHANTSYPQRKEVIYSKRTDILIEGFAKYLKNAGSQMPKLLLAEYGPHVNASKDLIANLGITENVYWFRELKRKQIMQFLWRVDATAGEFMDAAVTCGVVLESLASGKPLMNALSITNEEYKAQTGSPLPPILPCSSVEDVERTLINLERDKEKRLTIGQQGKIWFDNYAGRGLAEAFLRDFKDTFKQKTANPEVC